MNTELSTILIFPENLLRSCLLSSVNIFLIASINFKFWVLSQHINIVKFPFLKSHSQILCVIHQSLKNVIKLLLHLQASVEYPPNAERISNNHISIYETA